MGLACLTYTVPENAPIEHKTICDLVNKGYNLPELFRAAYTFNRIHFEQQATNRGRSKVEAGLFRGLSLYPISLASALMPKIQGTYEKEAQDYLAKESESSDRFLDIGWAEGFYLAGIARWRQIPCHGVDIDPGSQNAAQYVAKNNKLENLISFSKSLSGLEEFITGKLLCLVDVDGSEFEVLRSLNMLFNQAESLKSVLLIVESDDSQFRRQNTPELIFELAKSDWLIESTIKQRACDRFVDTNSELSFLEQVVLGAEGRPGGQCWVAARKRFR